MPFTTSDMEPLYKGLGAHLDVLNKKFDDLLQSTNNRLDHALECDSALEIINVHANVTRAWLHLGEHLYVDEAVRALRTDYLTCTPGERTNASDARGRVGQPSL